MVSCCCVLVLVLRNAEIKVATHAADVTCPMPLSSTCTASAVSLDCCYLISPHLSLQLAPWPELVNAAANLNNHSPCLFTTEVCRALVVHLLCDPFAVVWNLFVKASS